MLKVEMLTDNGKISEGDINEIAIVLDNAGIDLLCEELQRLKSPLFRNISWGVQKSFSSPNDPLCEFLKFPRRVQKIISPQNDTNRDLFKYISS